MCVHVCVCVQSLRRVWLFVTPWTIARQAPLSMQFSRQEYWSGLPFPPPVYLPDPRIEPTSPVPPALQSDSLLLSHQGNPWHYHGQSSRCKNPSHHVGVEERHPCNYGMILSLKGCQPRDVNKSNPKLSLSNTFTFKPIFCNICKKFPFSQTFPILDFTSPHLPPWIQQGFIIAFMEAEST